MHSVIKHLLFARPQPACAVAAGSGTEELAVSRFPRERAALPVWVLNNTARAFVDAVQPRRFPASAPGAVHVRAIPSGWFFELPARFRKKTSF